MRRTKGLNITILTLSIISFVTFFLGYVVDPETNEVISFLTYMFGGYSYAMMLATLSALLIGLIIVWDIIDNIILLKNQNAEIGKYRKISRKLMLITAILSLCLQVLVYMNIDTAELLSGYNIISICILVRSILKFITFAKTKQN